MNNLKIRKGDKVKVVSGKDKGRQGVVEKVFPKKEKVLVAGVNIYKKHSKPRKEGEKGGIIDMVRPLTISKVQLICPKCNKVTRVGQRPGEKKSRICRKCEESI